jgi:hypothetical protein
MEVEKTVTDKNGRDIKVGDYVKVINRITGSVEDSVIITKIEGRQVHLGVGPNINGMEISNVYFSDQIVKQY